MAVNSMLLKMAVFKEGRVFQVRVKGIFRSITLIMCLFGGGVFVFRTKHHFLTEDASEAPVKPLHASGR